MDTSAMALLDSLPLLGTLQAAILLIYLLLRRRVDFGRTALELALLVGLTLGQFAVPGGTNTLGLGGWGALAWPIVVPTAVAFACDVMGIRLNRWGWLLGWLALIPIAMIMVAELWLDGCLPVAPSCGWIWIAQSAWVMVMAFWGTWLIGMRLEAVAVVLRQHSMGGTRLVAALALAFILCVRGLVELAYLGSPSMAAEATRWGSLGWFLGLSLLMVSLTRLYPETADAALELNDQESIDRFRRHLAHAVVFEEGGVSPLARASVLTTILTVLALLGWSAVTPVKEVAATSGQVVPSGQIRPIQHLEGGIVAEVLVREGQLVQKGEVLLRLDPAQAMAELEQVKVREAGLELRAERLRAFAEGRLPDFSLVSAIAGDGQASDQGTIFKAQEAARDSSVAVLERQIAQRRSEINQYEGQHHALGEQLHLVEREVAIRSDLLAKGLNSQVSFLTIKRESERLKGESSRLLAQLHTSRESLAEAESRLQDQRSKLIQDAVTEMGTAGAELAQLRETRGKLEDRVQRLALVAPVRGIVQELSVASPGAVIPQGGMVTKIVPVDDVLLVENQIQPRDVGHVQPGQPVRIKVSSYDFARFGAVEGVLTQISPSTFLDDDKLPYYKGVVTLAKAYVGDDPERNRILPGMTVQADVVTGEKTILQYLLKPIQLAASQAFRER
ncbi:HlyD family type I secretion periplasmic adaptor subunit [Paramagnetospirillum marisnigri]|nr:HlyD family type I secretion periplasmic adaptor subunit [Paramagnetospirillum marisnigri]